MSKAISITMEDSMIVIKLGAAMFMLVISRLIYNVSIVLTGVV